MKLPPPLGPILDRALSAPSTFARAVATDADGTLWEGDVGDALFCLVAARDDFRGKGLERLRQHGAELLGPEFVGASGRAIAEALYARYSEGLIDVRVMCDLEAACVADRPGVELHALIDEVAEQAIPRVRGEVQTLLQAARSAGLAIHVVTGSLGSVVEATLARAGITVDSVTGAVLHYEGGKALASLARSSPLFEGKIAALQDAEAGRQRSDSATARGITRFYARCTFRCWCIRRRSSSRRCGTCRGR